MAAQPQQNISVIDPDNVPETLCDGRFNIHPHGRLATLTFTCSRPDADDLFRDGTINAKEVVRARITMTIENMAALRDLLVRTIKTEKEATPATTGASGGTRH
jgi:hypothetical protein